MKGKQGREQLPDSHKLDIKKKRANSEERLQRPIKLQVV